MNVRETEDESIFGAVFDTIMTRIKYLAQLLTAILFVAASCRQSPQSEVAVVSIPEDILINRSITLQRDLIDEIEYIPLETSPQSMLAENSQLVVSPFGYTVLDEVQNTVKHFSKDGKYLFDVGRFGRGPGEYAAPKSVSYDDCCFYVLDQLSLHKYNALDGSFVEKYPLSRYCVQAVVRGDIVYCVDVVSENRDIIFSTRLSDLDYVNILYRGYRNRSIGTDHKPLLSSSERILFCDIYLGKVYELIDEELQLLIDYDFSGRTIPEKMLNNGTGTQIQDIISDFGYACIVTGNVVFDYHDEQYEYHVCKVNLETKQMTELAYKYTTNEPQYLSFWHSQCSDGEFLYRIEQPYFTFITDEICGDSIPERFASFRKVVDLTREDDNGFIVKTRLK